MPRRYGKWGKLGDVGLAGVAMWLRDQGLSPTKATEYMRRAFGLKTSWRTVDRFWKQVDLAMEDGGEIPEIPTKDAVDELKRVKGQDLEAKRLTSDLRVERALVVAEVSTAEAPAADALDPDASSDEDDALRLSAVIDWAMRVSRTGVHRVKIPRWLAQDLFSTHRRGLGDDEPSIEIDAAAIEHGLFIRACSAIGHPDDLIEVAQIYDPNQRIKAAGALVRAIAAKYDLQKKPLPPVNIGQLNIAVSAEERKMELVLKTMSTEALVALASASVDKGAGGGNGSGGNGARPSEAIVEAEAG